MNVLILAHKHDTGSNTKLLSAIERLGHQAQIVSPLDCTITLMHEDPAIAHPVCDIRSADAVILRCSGFTQFAANILRPYEYLVACHLRAMGALCFNNPEAKTTAHNKIVSLQLLSQARIPIPRTIVTWQARDLKQAIDDSLGMPLILKLSGGTFGVGVMKLDTVESAASTFEAIHSLERVVMAQKFIEEARGEDIRAFVIGDRVVAAMRRKARAGEFRANVHQGGATEVLVLSDAYQQMAIAAARAIGCEIAGVDLLETRDGPVVIEVNSSPGLEGIEAATGIDVSAEIIRYIERQVHARDATVDTALL